MDATDRRGQSQAERRLGPGGPSVLGGHGRRGRRPAPQRGRMVETPPRAAVALGPDGGVLPGHRPLRRREGARHAGNPVEQPRRARRNRARQAALHHVVQHRYGAVESGECRGHGLDGAYAVVRFGVAGRVWAAAADGAGGPGGGPGADGRAVQALCAWRWPRWPAARRKANTISCRCCWWPHRW